MQTTDLAYPGDFTNGKTIRREVAHTISQIEIAVQQGAPVDARFAQFLEDAAAKTPGYVAPTLPATQVVVSDGGTVNVENSAGALDSPATATVAGGVLTGVKLAATKTILTQGQTVSVTDASAAPSVNATAAVAAGVVTALTLATSTDCILQNGFTVPIKHFDGSVVASTGVIAEVVAGNMVSAKLPTGRALVTTATKVPVGTVSGSGTFGTFTVVNGVITGIVLSAS